MPEPTPSQLKIDGIVTVPEGTTVEQFRELFMYWLGTTYQWNGNISPLNPDSESFMVEVERARLNTYEKTISDQWKAIEKYQEEAEANDKAYSDLAEQLRQEKENNERLGLVYRKSLDIRDSQRLTIELLSSEKEALELRLRLKDSPIKAGLKRIWKWLVKNFRATVNQ